MTSKAVIARPAELPLWEGISTGHSEALKLPLLEGPLGEGACVVAYHLVSVTKSLVQFSPWYLAALFCMRRLWGCLAHHSEVRRQGEGFCNNLAPCADMKFLHGLSPPLDLQQEVPLDACHINTNRTKETMGKFYW